MINFIPHFHIYSPLLTRSHLFISTHSVAFIHFYSLCHIYSFLLTLSHLFIITHSVTFVHFYSLCHRLTFIHFNSLFHIMYLNADFLIIHFTSLTFVTSNYVNSLIHLFLLQLTFSHFFKLFLSHYSLQLMLSHYSLQLTLSHVFTSTHSHLSL